jgi:hypothetical protein
MLPRGEGGTASDFWAGGGWILRADPAGHQPKPLNWKQLNRRWTVKITKPNGAFLVYGPVQGLNAADAINRVCTSKGHPVWVGTQ